MRNRLAGLFLLTAGAAFAFPNPDAGCQITTPSILPPAVYGKAYSVTIATSGCGSPLRFQAAVSGTLPPGLELTYSGSTATLSGTAYGLGTQVFAIRAIDTAYKIPSKSFVLYGNHPLEIQTAAIASGAPGQAYTDTILAAGGIAPYTFSVVEGSLPSGLVLNPSTGTISGTMPASGSQFRIRVTDSASVPNTVESPYTIFPTGRLLTTSIPVAVASTPYVLDIDGSLGAAGFAIALGNLPQGLTMDTNGVFAGTPTTPGDYCFTVRQTVGTTSAWRSYRLRVRGPITIISHLNDAEEAFAYNGYVSAEGSVGPYTFALTSGSLPAGLTLNTTTGAITGELPVGSLGTSFTVTATDATGATGAQGFTINRVLRLVGSINSVATVRVNNMGMAIPYVLSQGAAGKEYAIIGGAGDTGITVNPTTADTFYEMPTPGTFTPIVLGTDSLGGAVVFNAPAYQVVGNLAISSATELPNGRTSVSYNALVTVQNGQFTPLSYSVTAGSLPGGLTLNPTSGAITGTPSAGIGGLTFPFTVTVTDAASQSANRSFFIGIGGPLGITTTFLPGGTIGTPYNATLTQSGASGPTWSNPGGGLPPGVSLSSAGVFSGTPNTAGSYTFLVRLAHAATGDTDTKQFTIHVANPMTAIVATSPWEVTPGISGSLPISTVGGRGPVTLSITGGTLPEGLYLQNLAPLAITGIPKVPGTSNFTIQVTDADGRSTSIPYTINVRQQVRITSRTLAPGTIGVAYNQPLTASLGLGGPYTWSMAGGSLPSGLTLSPTGAITGIPTLTQTANFTLFAADAAGRGEELSFTIDVAAAPVITSPAPLPPGALLRTYSQSLSYSGGTGFHFFRVTSGDVPPLFSIENSEGTSFGGLPLVPGVYNFTLESEDSQGRKATKAEQITIGPGITINPASIPAAQVGVPYSTQITATGNIGAVTWSTSLYPPPPWLTIHPTTGVLSGTPPATGFFHFGVDATDSTGQTFMQVYSMNIVNALGISPSSLPGGTVGTGYSQTLTASGATGAVTWSVSSGTLPGGLALSTGGLLNGTPTTAGTFNFSVTGVDSVGNFGTRAYTVQILSVLGISPATLPSPQVGTPYSQTLTASNSTGAVTWSVTGGTLPAGLTLSPAGLLSGNPTTAGGASFTVTAVDSLTATGSRLYTVTVLSQLGVSPATVPNGVVGTAYSQTFTASNATGTVTWAVTSGAVPSGLAFTNAGVLSGNPTVAGSYSFAVTATDSAAGTGSRSYTMQVVNPLGINPATLPNGTVGTGYSQTFTATGATGAVTWSVATGTLPAGLTLSSAGVLSGTPSAAGSSSFTVSAVDSVGTPGSRAYTLQVLAVLPITPATLPNGTVGTAYNQTLTATGATGAVTWSVSTGTLPAGLSLSSAGVLSGTPTTAGSSTFTVSAVDSTTASGSQSYTVQVLPVLGVNPATLPNGTVGTAYNQTLTATGASGAVTWSVSTGTLPAGLTLSSAGVLSGTPTTAGPSTFTVSAVDSVTASGTRSYTMQVLAVLGVTPATLPNGTVGTAYSQTLTAANATGAVTWSVSAGTLPAGLTLSSAGLLSGTPSAAGSSAFTVSAVDSITASGTQSYTLLIQGVLPIAPATLPNGTVGTTYTQTLSATGASGSVTWSVSSGTLPAGLTLSPAGLLSGTPTTAGVSNFTVTAADSASASGAQAYTLTVQGVLPITPATLPNGVVGTAYSQTLSATGASGAVTWSVTNGTLPAGLTLSSAGLLSGTPTTVSSSTFTVTAVDAASASGARSYTLQILGVLSIAPASLPNATAGTPYSQTLTATGATGAVTFSVTSGTLPAGLTLSSAGLLSGTPATAGSTPFTVTAVDSQNANGTRSYTLTVQGTLSIAPATLPNGAVGTPYSQTLTATGATGAVTWSVTTGSLPAGLTLSSAGLLSGTPTTAGPASFAVTATDGQPASGSRSYTLTIGQPLVINPATLPNGTVGTPYSQNLTVAAVTGGITFSLGSGTLPGGLTLTPAGLLSGTPTAAGPSTFTVNALDSQGQTGSRTYTLTIGVPLAVNPATLPNGTVGTPYSQTLTTTPAGTNVVFSLGSGTLPGGLTLTPAGLLSGTPTAAGPSTFTVNALDSLGQTGSRSYTVTIGVSLTINPATLPAVTSGQAYSQTLTAANAAGALTWAVAGGSLPIGLTLNTATGLLSGTTNASPGLYPFVAQVTDAQGQSGQRSYNLNLIPQLVINPATLPDGTLGTAYDQSITPTGAVGPAAFAISSGALPAGLTLGTATGRILGTPTAAGPASFEVRVTTELQSATRSYRISVVDPIAIVNTSLPEGGEQEAYSAQFTATGAPTGSLNWSILNGALPPGVTLTAPTGVLSGAPSKSGTYTFTVQVVSSTGSRLSKEFSILVLPLLSIVNGSLGEAQLTRTYQANLTATGGRAPYTWSTSTALPAGLILNPATGIIAGTPTGPEGPAPQTVVVRDARGQTARKVLALTVAPAPPPSLSISPDSLPNGRVGQAYSALFTGNGGTPGYTIAIVQGAPPPGLSMVNGALTGTPTQEGTFRFTVNVTDSGGRVAGNSYAVLIEAALLPLSVTPSSIPPTAQIGQPFSAQFGATGGKAPYTFSFSGNTPPGTSTNSSGLLSGTPSQGGTFTFTVEVTDALQTRASRSYSVTIAGNLAITTRPPLANGLVGTAYGVTFGASGGRPPYTWSISGNTPPGLSFDSASGSLAGTPSTAGTFAFTVQVQDAQQLTASVGFSITVFEPLVITNSPAATPLTVGTPFNFAFTTRGGRAPVSFSLSGGGLPAGLSLSGSGEITGTPTLPGTFGFTVQATDSAGNTATQQATLRVVSPLTVTTASLPSGTVGAVYTASLAAAGGIPPLGAWSLSAGSLPAGLTLAADGTISGTPTAAGPANFTVRIVDSVNTEATRALSIAIALPPVPPITVLGLPQTLPPGAQTNITIQLAQPFPVDVTGTLTLIFEPNAANNADDPSVQFSSGGRTVTFTIPAGQTVGTFPVNPLRLLTGTVAGSIRILTTTSPASATPVPETVVSIARSVPVITAGTAQLGTGTFTLLIDGFSNTREILSATFRLTPVTGAPLQTTDVPVQVAAAFTTYYQSAASIPFGGQFRLTMPFNVSGSLADIDTVIVTVTNSVGTSQPFTVRLR